MPTTLETLFDTAPYLAELADRHADWFAGVRDAPPDETAAELIAEVQASGARGADREAVGAELRRAKAKLALLAGAAECTGGWTTEQATRALSDFADAALGAALDVLVREAAAAGQIEIDAEARPGSQSGLAILALGKLGGQELNFSSDIDLVAFYDRERARLAEPSEAPRFYEKMVRALTALIAERDEGGYVFRTDLRLRPDPGSTPVAISTEAALSYYESRGQNWERAAWIKARPAAGDTEGAEAFLRELAPFIWRKHLDFATIADIQAMKRQINAARKIGGERTRGHNVKLGRGGIREIEFFAQTQQLIAGGREPALRSRSTVRTLRSLAEHRFIAPAASEMLIEAYWFLRAVENRLQMRGDEQTHVMPDKLEGVEVVARMMGFDDDAEFRDRYRATVETVIETYGELFAEEATLASSAGNLVFTGGEDDPATLETLARIGFREPEKASATIRKWHYGGYAATRAPAARAHLTELVPSLLDALAESGDADDALQRFDAFLGKLPTGVQLFALLRNSEPLRRVFVDFMAAAPRMTEAVVRRVHIVDGLIDPEFYGNVPTREEMEHRIGAFLAEARGFEDLLDRARIMGQEQVFLTSAGLIAGTIRPDQAGAQYSIIAEILLARVFDAVRAELERRHGIVPGARAGLLAFGKFASREMTATSDLDLVLVYDAPMGADLSDGERPLETPHYFARLTQRLVAALSSPTAEGVLYQVDMRLRPSGKAGPLATSLKGFEDYQRNKAWTWEHLALSRARVVHADNALAADIDAVIAEVLAAPRDPAKTIADVVDMRERLARERPPKNDFDLKLVPGGLVDLEFIAQAAQLLHGAVLQAPGAPPAEVLARLEERGLLEGGARLAEIHGRYTTILQTMSACLTDPLNVEGWREGFRELLLRVTYMPDMSRLEADLEAMREEVSEAFARFLKTEE